ncbi:uncharacterized protein BKA55DRAFT_586067, partial [Fusarium redolens]
MCHFHINKCNECNVDVVECDTECRASEERKQLCSVNEATSTTKRKTRRCTDCVEITSPAASELNDSESGSDNYSTSDII